MSHNRMRIRNTGSLSFYKKKNAECLLDSLSDGIKKTFIGIPNNLYEKDAESLTWTWSDGI